MSASIWSPTTEILSPGVYEDFADTSDVTKGDALVGVKLTESNSAERTQHDLNEEKIRTPADYSDTLATALATFNTNKAAGGRLRIPAGTHFLTTGAVFDGQRCNLAGEGRQVSILDFRPAGADAALTYNNVSAGGMYQGSITGFGFNGGPNTQVKTAIKLVNTANVEVSNIGIAGGTWLGESIGLHTAGRQSLKFSYSEIVCDRPVVCSKNATYPSLCTDHFVFEHLELIGTSATRPVVEFEPDVMHTNTTFRNIAWVGGKNGLEWLEAGSAGTSYMLTIDQGRFEQAINTSGIGYCVRLEGTTRGLQSLAIRDTYFGTDSATPRHREGLYLRRVQNVTLENCWFAQEAGRIAIDMTFEAGCRLTLINCFIDSAATFTLTNARCISKTTAANRISGEWVYDPGTQAGFSSGEVSNDVYNTGTAITIPNASYITIASQTFVGYVFISTDEDFGALFFLKGATGGSTEVNDPDAVFTNAVGGVNSYNVYWDAGSTSYRLQNNRTVGNHAVRVFRIGGVV